MLKNRLLHSVITVQFAVFLAHSSVALEKVSAEEILSLCAAFKLEKQLIEDPAQKKDKALCAMYIKGFLAGEEIHRNHHNTKPSFEERAIKTRAAGLLNKMGDSVETEFCIPKTTTLEDIVSLINQQEPVLNSSAEALLTNVLRSDFQCGK